MTQSLGYVLKLKDKQEFFSLMADLKAIFVLEGKTTVFRLFVSKSDAYEVQKYLHEEYGLQTEIVFFDRYDLYRETIAYLN